MVDLQNVKPYGDTLDDGMVQLSFTPPVALSSVAKEAARQLVASMGLDEPAVAHAEAISKEFSFFVSMQNVSKG
jgi:beta-lysine 5,6-aminomutase beta subunit